MNITPEQIPDEVMEAAFDAMRLAEARQFGDVKTPNNGARHECMRAALAAALPVLLVPVTFKYRRLGSVDPNEWYPCSRELYDAFHAGTTKSKDLEFVPLTYTLPTLETPTTGSHKEQ